MADTGSGDGAGADKPYDANLKSLKEKSESDKVDAMDLASKLAYHRSQANQLAGGSLPYGYNSMSAEDKIAAIGGANGLNQDDASTVTDQIQTHIDEANKIQEQITKAFSEGQEKVDSKKAESGFNQSVAGFNYDKNDTAPFHV